MTLHFWNTSVLDVGNQLSKLVKLYNIFWRKQECLKPDTYSNINDTHHVLKEFMWHISRNFLSSLKFGYEMLYIRGFIGGGDITTTTIVIAIIATTFHYWIMSILFNNNSINV